MPIKTAVVLFNLGGPDKLGSVQQFLFNLFNDRAIISAPQPIRWMLAKLISTRRNKKAQGIYALMGGKSTILEETEAQRRALEEALRHHGDYRVFISMRYWHPMSDETVANVQAYNPDKIILLPLYPQFSTTTTASSFKDWQETADKAGLTQPASKICCYYKNALFVKAYADLTLEYYKKAAKFGLPRILFSAHGIPLNRIIKGDPYQQQVEQSVAGVIAKMGIKNLDYSICYQSRVGPLKWLQPSAETELTRAAKDGVPIVLVPMSFVSEHSETLVELDIQYRELVEELGNKHYFRVPALRTNITFIKCLESLCLNSANSISKCEAGMSACSMFKNRTRDCMQQSSNPCS